MNLSDLVRRVTDFTLGHHDERDCWMKAPAISAVLLSGTQVDIAVVDGWLRRAIATQRTRRACTDERRPGRRVPVLRRLSRRDG